MRQAGQLIGEFRNNLVPPPAPAPILPACKGQTERAPWGFPKTTALPRSEFLEILNRILRSYGGEGALRGRFQVE
jgi:hypothetical protein